MRCGAKICQKARGTTPDMSGQYLKRITNVKQSKTSYTYEILCGSIVDTHQHTNVIAKYDSGTSNNYWRTENMLVLINLKDNRGGPTVQSPNNLTMNATKTGSTPLAGSLSTNSKKAQVFDGVHRSLLICLQHSPYWIHIQTHG